MSYGTPPPSGSEPHENDPTAPGSYGSTPPPPPPSYGSQDQPSYGSSSQPPSYGSPQQPSYGAPSDQPSYGAPQEQQGGYPAPQSPYGSPQQPGYAAAPPPYAGGSPYGGPATNNTKALVSMILGIVGILICGLLGPVALVLGRQAKAEIAASNGQQKGGGMAQAGFILGIVATVFLVIQVIYVISVVSSGNR